MEIKVNQTLNWNIKSNELFIQGALNRDSLFPLYAQRNEFKQIKVINLKDLERLDSAGLALIVQLALQSYPDTTFITGANSNILALIDAYHLPLHFA